MESKLLYFILESFVVQNQIEKTITGSSQKTISLRDIRAINVPIPPLPEQKQIADILSTVDNKLDVLRSKKANYEMLKKGLMEQLLTGKKRVKV